MHTAKRLLLGAALAALVGGTTVAQPLQPKQPAANQPVARAVDVKVGTAGELLVPSGGVVRFKPKFTKPFKDVIVANDNIVLVRLVADDPEAVELVGLAAGVTKLIFTLTDGSKGEFEVVVQPDYELLKRVIAKAVPTASIEVIPGVGNSIILAGYVNRPEDAETVMMIARASVITSSTSTSAQGNSTGIGVNPAAPGAPLPGLAGPGNGGVSSVNNVSVSSTTTSVGTIVNAIQVGGLQHVQIEVTFASVDRTKLRQRGANFSIVGTEGSFISNILTTQNNITVGIVPAGINLALLALKTEGLAKVLTEPKVVTQSGRPAIIRSGGQQAVLSATGGGLGSISVSLENVGTTMQVLPIVYGNGKIYLEVAPSVRQVNNGLGIQTTAGFSPGFSEQSASASVMLESGQTFAIGGLLESTTQAIATRVPVLGEIPGLNYFFTSNSMDERERELLIMVTPRLVDSLDCGQTPKRVPGRETRSLDDYEFYLEGLLEAPRGQRQVWNGRCYQAAYKCDPTYGVFPCKGNVCGANGGNGGNCAGGAGSPTNLPTLTTTPAAPPVAMPAPVPGTNTGLSTTPTVEPIVMPQVAPAINIPEAVVPGTATEVPASAPLAPATLPQGGVK